MRLSSLSSSFVFNLPSDLLPPEIMATYTPYLEKNWIQYDNVLDYLNSTIKGTDFPGLSIETPTQTLKRGKQRSFKPATNINDIVTTRELNITFRSVDCHLNYMLLFDIFSKNYLDVVNPHAKPFMLTMLDIHRDAIYQVRFEEIILKSLSSRDFNYNQQSIAEDTFVLTILFNFYEVEFMLNQSKVLELGNVPTIIQRL